MCTSPPPSCASSILAAAVSVSHLWLPHLSALRSSGLGHSLGFWATVMVGFHVNLPQIWLTWVGNLNWWTVLTALISVGMLIRWFTLLLLLLVSSLRSKPAFPGFPHWLGILCSPGTFQIFCTGFGIAEVAQPQGLSAYWVLCLSSVRQTLWGYTDYWGTQSQGLSS